MAPSIYPVLRFADADKARAFLGEALGFREVSVHRDDGGTIVHALMAWQDDLFMFSGSKGAGDPFDLGPVVASTIPTPTTTGRWAPGPRWSWS